MISLFEIFFLLTISKISQFHQIGYECILAEIRSMKCLSQRKEIPQTLGGYVMLL